MSEVIHLWESSCSLKLLPVNINFSSGVSFYKFGRTSHFSSSCYNLSEKGSEEFKDCGKVKPSSSPLHWLLLVLVLAPLPAQLPPFPLLALPLPPSRPRSPTHLVFHCFHTVCRSVPLLIGCPGGPPAEAFYLSPLFLLFFKESCAPSTKIQVELVGRGRKTSFS